MNDENEIIMRLFDENQIYFKFLDKMALYYEHDDQHLVDEIVPWRIYAAHSESSTLRVRALVQNGDQVKCFYVDDGGFDVLPITSLRQIPSDILQIPLQVFMARLHNLGKYENDVRIKKLLDKMIQKAENGLALIAEPIPNSKPLTVILRDTSGDQDVVLNEVFCNYLTSIDEFKLNSTEM